LCTSLWTVFSSACSTDERISAGSSPAIRAISSRAMCSALLRMRRSAAAADRLARQRR
jgi:hypothetical protein